MKITLLTSKNSYLNNYKDKFTEVFKLYDFSIINDKKYLKKGDICFILSYYELLQEEFFGLNKYNIVIHESDLPKGKGWSPASWQILEGKNEIPLTMFEITKKVDAGDVYLKDKVILNGYELIDDWQEKIVNKKIEMCKKFVENYGNIKPIPQSGEETFYKKRTPEDCILDVNKTIKEQFNLLRIVNNDSYPAYFMMDGNKYKLKIEKYN